MVARRWGLIARMLEVFVAARAADKERLLEALRDSGVVHLEPVAPARARADEALLSDVQRLSRAEQILSTVEPEGSAPSVAPLEAAGEVTEIFSRASELQSRLTAAQREVDRLALWGDTRLAELAALKDEGLVIELARVPAEAAGQVEAECVQRFADGKQTLVVAVSRAGRGAIGWPEGAEPVELPLRDRPAVREEAAGFDRTLKEDAARLRRLAHLRPQVTEERERLEEKVRWVEAERGGLEGEDLFALRGWLPADRAEKLTKDLERAGLPFALRTEEPSEEHDPPTLVRLPKAVRPIEGLFDILGTVPGYREFDVSAAFLLALPIFAAMLIADGGYGLALLLPALLFYGKMCRAVGKALTQLVMIIGGTSLVWGLFISSFFGIGDTHLMQAGGVLASVGQVLHGFKLIEGSYTDDEVVRQIIRLSFLLGAIHLSFAHLWRAYSLLPSLRALAHVGWAAFLWGVLFVTYGLVLGMESPGFLMPLLIGGGALAIIFAEPNRNPLKMLAMGLASFPLAAMGTLSDIISYIRLMAVGLASTILAATFNTLAAQLAETATWGAGAIILVFGHTLNIGLAVIALFAHGVRLNMLEFSNNLGMTWSGYPFAPFAATTRSNKNA